MTWKRQKGKREWLISCCWSDDHNPTYATYRQGEDVCWLRIATGIGREASGASYGSLVQWEGQRGIILKHLKACDGMWFCDFLDKGIAGESFSEQEVLAAFQMHSGRLPIEICGDGDVVIVDALTQFEKQNE